MGEPAPEEQFVFARQPVCSRRCLEEILHAVLAHEHELASAAALSQVPRVRLGQILVQQGAITEAQLERALRSQRITGAGRLGTWLRQQTQLPEEEFAAALSIQWQCPVFKIGAFASERMASLLPRALSEALDALPLRLSRDPERLTICFEDHLDAELLRACERMHGIAVEGGLLTSNEFWYGSGELLKASFPPATVVEADSLEEMIEAMTETTASSLVADAQLVSMHGYYWLRLWTPDADGVALTVHDVLCTLRRTPENVPKRQLIHRMSEGLDRKGTRVN